MEKYSFLQPLTLVDQHIQETVVLQRKKIFKIANELGVHLTDEDILNPHDYPVLMKSARFNFEDGFLAGLLATQLIVRRLLQE